MAPHKRRPFIWSIHGMTTHAHWQTVLRDEIRNNKHHKLRHVSYRFGYYSLPRFLWGPSREKMVELFRDEYFQNMKEAEPNPKKWPIYRPSIVAHSFGAFIVGECMLKYEDIVFDKILLCGSILPRIFDWDLLLQRHQVWKVRNEYGLLDRWSKLASAVSSRMGDSGAAGFSFEGPPCFLEQHEFSRHEHSDYFKPAHMNSYWFPFFGNPSLKFEIVHGSAITDEKQLDSFLRQCREIDEKSYADLPRYDEARLNAGTSLTWIRVNPDIYTFLMDPERNQVLGYINAMPVTDQLYEKILSGEVKDKDVTANHIRLYSRGESVKLYVMSVAIEPGARLLTDGAFQLPYIKLLYAAINKLVSLARTRKIKVTSIVAIGWSEEGRTICKEYGLRENGTDQFGNPIYELPLTQALLSDGQRYFGGIKHLLRASKPN